MTTRSRAVTGALLVAPAGTGGGAILAATNGSSSGGSSANSQYCPPNSPGGENPKDPQNGGNQCGTPGSPGNPNGGTARVAAARTSGKKKSRLPKGAKAQCRQLNRYRAIGAHGRHMSASQKSRMRQLKANLTKHGYTCGRRLGRDVLRKTKAHGKH